MFFLLVLELYINIYRTKEIDSTPTSQYRTPTEEFEHESLPFHRQSIISSVPPGNHQQNQNERKISFQIKQLEMGMVQRTYDMKVSLK